MAKASALVLSSGGLHSLVAAGLASREYRVGMLHIDDGRATSKQAAAAFAKQVAHFKPFKSWVIDLRFLREIALPAEATGVVTATGSDAHARLMPLRELQFLSIAAGFAKSIHASALLWGIQREQRDADALAENLEMTQLFNQLLEFMTSTAPLVLKTPLMGLEDQQVVELGYQMGVPFSASWTCQMDVAAPCMSCSACARRIRAFRAAQLTDPLVVKPK